MCNIASINSKQLLISLLLVNLVSGNWHTLPKRNASEREQGCCSEIQQPLGGILPHFPKPSVSMMREWWNDLSWEEIDDVNLTHRLRQQKALTNELPMLEILMYNTPAQVFIALIQPLWTPTGGLCTPGQCCNSVCSSPLWWGSISASLGGTTGLKDRVTSGWWCSVSGPIFLDVFINDLDTL